MNKKKIAIALQGGGFQSAFAWGVLDLFLSDDRFEILGISSTGLGGILGTALIQGLLSGGRESAQKKLREYWIGLHEVSKNLEMFLPNPLEKMINYYNFSNPDFSKSGISPYEKNPLNINPLIDFIDSFFDFSLINEQTHRKIFISATHVESGKIKIFSNKDINSKTLMASFCLPYIFHAVEIDGQHYWDGGLVANPAIYPLIDEVDTQDIVVIQLERSYCQKVPMTQESIDARIKEINYNSHLLREMRAIYFISKLIDDQKLVDGSLKRINMHVIRNENLNIFKEVRDLSSNWGDIIGLYADGYTCAKKWLSLNFDNVGKNHSELRDEIFSYYL